MTFVFIALASIVLAFGPQVVLSFDSITFSAVQQCGNFSVHFSGGKLPSSLPLTLTVVPFNHTPISIEISNSDWDATKLTGAAVTFLPFPTDTQFVASLDDASGASTGPVSDVIRIESSDDTSCLSSSFSSAQQRYTVNSTLLQCQEFNVTYDPSAVDSPPTVRSFVPKGQSLFLNEDVLATRNSLGRAAYSMAATQGQQVVLTFSDDTGFRQATDLLPVGGSSNSSTACLPSNQTASATSGQTSATAAASGSTSRGGLSQGGIIAIAVVCGLSVCAIGGAMIFWFCRERGRVRRRLVKTGAENPWQDGNIPSGDQMKMSFWVDSSHHSPGFQATSEKPLPKAPSATSGGSLAVMRNPAYTQTSLDFGTPLPRPSTSSIPLSLPSDRVRPPSIPIPVYTPKSSFSDINGPMTRDSAPLPPTIVERDRSPSLTSDEIENILDMATLYSAPNSPRRQAKAFQTLSMEPLPSWRVSQGTGSAQNSPVSPNHAASSLSMRSVTTPGLLTPISASGEREPPQADLPSSPVPSPVTPGFPLPSIDEVSSQISGVGNWEIVSPRT